MDSTQWLALVVGESSGEALALPLMRQLQQLHPQLRFIGIGTEAMAELGMELIAPSRVLAVNGYTEVLARLPQLLSLRRRVVRECVARSVVGFVGVDAPDFNLGLARRFKRRHVLSIGYVCPQFWAWRPRRAKQLAAAVDHMLCLFNFEVPLLARHGVQATAVGHPVMSAIAALAPRGALRQQWQLAAQQPVLALLPGSREHEIDRLLPDMLRTAVQLKRRLPALVVLLPAASAELAERIQVHLGAHTEGWVRLLAGQSLAAMKVADMAVVASGTATLEAALLGLPMLIVYRVSALSYRLMKAQAQLPWIGLPNILANRPLVPEFVQEHVRSEELTEALWQLWCDRGQRQELGRKLEKLSQHVQAEHAAADVVASLLAQRR